MSHSPQLFSLFRSSRLTEPFFQRAVAKTPISSRPAYSALQHARRNTTNSFERYGPAKDLLPPPDKPSPSTSNNDANLSDSDKPQKTKSTDTEPEKLKKADPPKLQDAMTLDAAEGNTAELQETALLSLAEKPLEKVLQMPAPTSPKRIAPPHLEAPRYVHHFDTYTLVNDLNKGGFTQDQSITVMKAVRNLLADNLDLARQGLVSKSDVENESYLFRAACSELRTEVQSVRRLNADKMRSERALLQHEVDILSQKVTSDSMNLKDELRGLLDDRKMAAKIEQRSTESRIQEIHYRITSVMAGEAKGEVEGLRWYLTRTLVFTLAGIVLSGLTYISITTQTQHKKQEESKRLARESSATAQDASTSYTIPSRSAGTQTAQTDTVLAEMAADTGSSGSSGGYVSLG